MDKEEESSAKKEVEEEEGQEKKVEEKKLEENKKLQKIIRLCMESLSLPCANRSKENLLPLQAFTNKISEFKKLAQSAREELLRSAQLEKFEDKETVFLHGDYGDKYYVVLSGSVDISIPKYPNKGDTEKKKAKESHGSDESPPLEEEEPEEIVVAQLGAQCGFGELALITNSPRAATVRAAGVTYLMVFIREEYQNIVGGGLSKALEEKRNFFKGVSIFQQTEKNMQSTHLQNLIYFFQPKTYNKDEVVYREGDKATHCFLIKEGYCNLYITPRKHGYDDWKGSKELFVSVLGSKALFGEEEVLAQVPMNSTVIAGTTTEIYTLEAQILEEKIPKLIIDQILLEAKMKREYQKVRIASLIEAEEVHSKFRMKPTSLVSQVKSSHKSKSAKAARGAQNKDGKVEFAPKVPGDLTRRMKRNSTLIRANTISRLAKPKVPVGHDGIDLNRDSLEQAVLFVRPDALGRQARFRHLNRLKSVSTPSERVIRGYTDFNVDDQKKLLSDTISRKTVKASVK
ncbi:cyclic nucleotide-binding domain-containing protein [Chloropicon primus]|uniref:Cyclic nucleotide-binding domain-containing protein n=2 Tax=Chloropicon primus TaxID=1764295 RepID=A0A5B8ME70_9CHLO|nr:cyclic nucleotide-binding domain-containing protein [Chloropicon primus]UPQ97160.1 cyclic nucleotide-binding domain-containing protein [Chloropicon primus]|eukprot:QDZ17945.1 cyclic nucleotide-binding domain-containing protein [Chloropicon primus]